MPIDNRLKEYFRLSRLFHRTGEDIWFQMLKTLSRNEAGPGGQAALCLTSRAENKEKVSGDTG